MLNWYDYHTEVTEVEPGRPAAGPRLFTPAASGIPRAGMNAPFAPDLPVPAPVSAAAAPVAPGPLPAYRARVAAGALVADPAQALAAETLQDLWRRLRGYDPHPEAPDEGGGFLSRFFRRKSPEGAPAGTPHGLYLVGGVGRGKSMLMDLFFACAELGRKRRIHFHQFMQECHGRIHAWKQAHPGEPDPIPPLADTIAAEAALLCFDEFQVHDIADAMILGRLFEALFARGVVVVATSNTLPHDLFKGRPGRDAFLPFIALIRERLDVLVLDAARDYRRERILGLPTWHTPLGARAERALDAAFRELTGEAHGQPCSLSVLGRSLELPQVARGRGAGGFRYAVRPECSARRTTWPWRRTCTPWCWTGCRASVRRISTARAGSSPSWTRSTSTGASWWLPPKPRPTSCTRRARTRRCSSGRRAGSWRCRARNTSRFRI